MTTPTEYCPFVVGDRVVCVETPQEEIRSVMEIVRGVRLPFKGEVFTVRGLTANETTIGLWLVEIVNPPLPYDNGFGEVAFDYRLFRALKANETDISVFTELLNKAPVDEVVG